MNAREYSLKQEILEKRGITPATKHHDYNYLYKAIITAMEEYHQQKSQEEKVPDLSKLDEPSKDEFITEFVEMTAKNVLSVFVALGLKTHIEATVVNDADGNSYQLSFKNTKKSQEEAEERYGKGLQFFTDLMMSKFGWSAITIQEIADEALRIASGKEER
jgi:hypothetical protein